jgi:hypothetical protein
VETSEHETPALIGVLFEHVHTSAQSFHQLPFVKSLLDHVSDGMQTYPILARRHQAGDSID